MQLLTSLCMISMTSIAAPAAVSVVDAGKTIVLKNGAVSLRIEKNTGWINRLTHEGQSLLSPGQKGYVTILGRFVDDSGTTYTNRKETQVKSKFLRAENCAFKTHPSTPGMVDVSFTPHRPADFPFEMEYHYVLRENEAGFYVYIVARKPGDRPDALLTQLRFGMRIDDSMRHIRLNDERSGVLPATQAIADAKGMVMDATYLLQSDEIVTKYSWSSPTEDALVHGLHNGKQGAWIITGGNEYLCGGPTKQHNTSHGTDRGPILLKLFYSNHYGSHGSFVSGDWEKVFGPVFVYLNRKDDAQALWKDAKRQSEKHRKAWPYRWMKHPEYPVSRTVVTGRFDDTGATDLSKGWVVLAQPREYRGLDWQQQGADTYIYRARIEKEGTFAIPAVREGAYTLYAFASGRIGEFRRDGIPVNSAGTIDLGSLRWPQRSFGKLLWRVGTPDRSAAEYRRGDDFQRWGVWFDYPTDFPNDVDFTIGQSREQNDWNYAHMAIWDETGGWQPRLIPDDRVGEGSWRLPTWKVRFRCDKPIRGRATLTIALASVSADGGLAVGLNGTPLGNITGLTNDSALPRSGIRGIFREHLVTFDASRLNEGENVITLDLLPLKMHTGKRQNYPHFGIMYDVLQLEVNTDGSMAR